jgi:hypothetical protein
MKRCRTVRLQSNKYLTCCGFELSGYKSVFLLSSSYSSRLTTSLIRHHASSGRLYRLPRERPLRLLGCGLLVRKVEVARRVSLVREGALHAHVTRGGNGGGVVAVASGGGGGGAEKVPGKQMEKN